MITSSAIHSNLDKLITSLEKLDALLKIASSADIAGLKAETVFHYFWVTEDVVEQAKNACENLVRTMPFLLNEQH
ncbi:MAG: hypothetical protein K0S27_1644 [Gammaproteobacteria bacterium]|nr:hypothetical protein [Gammaproteobacteria bacterium]